MSGIALCLAYPTVVAVFAARAFVVCREVSHLPIRMASLADKKGETSRRAGGRRSRRKRGEKAATDASLPASTSTIAVRAATTPVEQIKAWIVRFGAEEDTPVETCEYLYNVVADASVDLEEVTGMIVGLSVAPMFESLPSSEQEKEATALLDTIRQPSKTTSMADGPVQTTRKYDNIPARTKEAPTAFLDLSDVNKRREWRQNETLKTVTDKDLKKKKSIASRLKASADAGNLRAPEGSNFEDCSVNLDGSNIKQSSNADSSRVNLNDVCLRLDGLMLAYDGTQLLNASDLRILTGHRYGLIGRNGVGKSTMMYHMEKMARTSMSVLYVAQEAEGSATTSALESVLEVDSVTNDLLERERVLVEQAEREDGNPSAPDLAAELNEISKSLEERDAASASSRASSILAGLSFTRQMQEAPTSSLSGGWRMRLALARALFLKPDLLLLDEPTNHLDLHAVIWLENYLASWSTTLIMVSHDSSFLNHVCTDIIEFRSRKLVFYKGNWDAYRKSSMDRYIAQTREYTKQQEDIAHKQEFVDKWKDNKFGYNRGMVQSRLKELAKMKEGGDLHIEKPLEPGGGLFFKFPQPEKLADPMIHMKNVSFAYENRPPLFLDQSLKVESGSRIGLVGPNGAGKSTLLKLCVGEAFGGLRPSDGAVVSKGKLRLAWFHQHFVEQINLSLCPLEEMRLIMGPKATEQDMRRRLGAFGVDSDLQVRRNKLLSGGQKARLALAKLAVMDPHVYVLDEPTNHLDIESVEALAKALVKFSGAVIFVSHDETFCRTVATELWHCEGGDDKNIEQLFCGFDGYRELVQQSLRL